MGVTVIGREVTPVGGREFLPDRNRSAIEILQRVAWQTHNPEN